MYPEANAGRVQGRI